MNKSVLAKICILIVLLAVLTVIYARQDITVRVELSEDTLVRSGQHLTASLDIGAGEWYTTYAEIPYYSIYEYNIEIPAGVWTRASQLLLEFGQVRRDDHIYIESISVKQPLYNERKFDSGYIYESLSDISSAGITLMGDSLIDIEVLATRAHTPSMSTEGPSFSLPTEALKASEALGSTYALSALALIAAWALAAFAVPSRVYVLIPLKLRELVGIVKNLSVMDIAIVLLGVTSLIFYYYGYSFLRDYRDFSYNLFSAAAVMLIIIKVMNVERTARHCCRKRSMDAERLSLEYWTKLRALGRQHVGQSTTELPSWMIYLLLLVLSAAVYIPAAFPNPYFSNDEFQVISAAEWFLEGGGFEQYDRAWPHTWLVAQAIKYFGLSTLSTRLTSALLGIVFIISAYYIVKKLSGRTNIAMLSALVLLCNPYLISIFATVRMYAVMMPISLWMFYCIYMTLHCEIKYKRDSAFTGFIKRNFNFHFGYAAAAIILIWLNFIIHINTMILLLCALVYVIVTACVSRQRKFINLSIIGIGIIVLSSVIYFLSVAEVLEIPAVSPLIRFIVDARLVEFIGLGWNNYDYFWTNINVPLGSFFGVFLLIIALAMCFKRNCGSDRSFVKYSAICYFVTVVFCVFFADRYYSYVYMAFLAPVTMMLVSNGYYGLTGKVQAPTKAAVSVLIATALALQMGSIFSSIYIDNPDETKFERPYMILDNDAKNEELEVVPLYATFARRYFFEIIENGDTFGSMSVQSGEVYELDKWVESVKTELPQPVAYFFSEQSKWWHTRGANGEFLEAATDLITDIDASVVRKYNIVEAIRIEDALRVDDGFHMLGDSAVLHITDVRWEGDVAYLQCEMGFVPEFNGAVFIAVEVIEQGIAQYATHKYQVFVPEDFGETDRLGLVLQLRPKTEEYAENITFDMADWAYVYYGANEAGIIELGTRNQK